MDDEVTKMLGEYAEGGLVSKNAMSDYFLASSGKMTEMEFVGKHKMSTLNFEDKFQSDNNVDIAGIESFSEINDKPKGVNMDYSKKPQMMYEGGEVDPVSGNNIPPGVAPENVRDDIPAMLSEGEYVIPADVLKFYGVNFFEKLRNKAKEGMDDLDSGGRIGGEKAKGKVEMAEGGVVEEPSRPSFDPSNYSTVGASTGKDMYGFSKDRKLASSAYDYREYTGPAGDIVKVLFVNGTAMGSVPEGYVPIGEAAKGTPAVVAPPPAPMEGPSNYGDLADPSGNEANGGMGLGDPLGALDFADSDSVENWASDRLSGSWDNKGAQLAGGAVAGPIGAGLAGAVAAARDIASVNAASLAAYANGDDTLGASLASRAAARADEIGILGIAPKSWYDGKSIYAGYAVKTNKDTPKVLPKAWKGVDRTGGNEQLEGYDLGSQAPTSTDPYGDYSKDGWNKGGLVTRRNKQPK
jgi:hypothetical protein